MKATAVKAPKAASLKKQARQSYMMHYVMMSPFLLAFLTFTILPILVTL